jgi:O-glycosyl hydrolase
MNVRLCLSRVLREFVLCAGLAICACGGITEAPVNGLVVIDTTGTHQTLVGFGAATAYKASLLSARTDDIYQVLFVDSGLDILRLGNWYQNQTSTNTTPTTPFGVSAAVQVVQMSQEQWHDPAASQQRLGRDRSGRHAHSKRWRVCLF